MNKVSIIVPCYNVANYVARCINSIVDQDYNNIEIIAINDASTDDTHKELISLDNMVNNSTSHKLGGG